MLTDPLRHLYGTTALTMVFQAISYQQMSNAGFTTRARTAPLLPMIPRIPQFVRDCCVQTVRTQSPQVHLLRAPVVEVRAHIGARRESVFQCSLLSGVGGRKVCVNLPAWRIVLASERTPGSVLFFRLKENKYLSK